MPRQPNGQTPVASRLRAPSQPQAVRRRVTGRLLDRKPSIRQLQIARRHDRSLAVVVRAPAQAIVERDVPVVVELRPCMRGHEHHEDCKKDAGCHGHLSLAPHFSAGKRRTPGLRSRRHDRRSQRGGSSAPDVATALSRLAAACRSSSRRLNSSRARAASSARPARA
jgi:hypothetical protein